MDLSNIFNGKGFVFDSKEYFNFSADHLYRLIRTCEDNGALLRAFQVNELNAYYVSEFKRSKKSRKRAKEFIQDCNDDARMFHYLSMHAEFIVDNVNSDIADTGYKLLVSGTVEFIPIDTNADQVLGEYVSRDTDDSFTRCIELIEQHTVTNKEEAILMVAEVLGISQLMYEEREAISKFISKYSKIHF